jgi:hypothetical protein
VPGKLKAQFMELRRHPGAAFCYSDFVFVDSAGREEEVRVRPFGNPLFVELLKGNLLATPSVVVRRNCFDEAGLFDETLRTGEDWDLWLRLSARFDCVGVRRPLVRCRKWDYDPKYRLDTLYRSTLRPLDKLFADPETLRRWPRLASVRPRVYAWHRSVLAKSYLRHGRILESCRMAMAAIRSHPAALVYLTRRGVMRGTFAM